MRTMTVGEFKSRFFEVLKDVEKGERIGITFGRKTRGQSNACASGGSKKGAEEAGDIGGDGKGSTYWTHTL